MAERRPAFHAGALRRVVLAAAVLLGAGPALALTASCQADLDRYGGARLEIINKINAFNKKRPSAKLACATFGDLVKSEADMLKWMEDNKEWCQLPDPFVEDFRKNTAQGIKVRGQACTAAKREGKVRTQQSSAPRGPAPGGVPLPKGAL